MQYHINPDRTSPRPTTIKNVHLFINLKREGVPQGLGLAHVAHSIMNAPAKVRDDMVLVLQAHDYAITADGYMMKCDRLLHRIAELRTGQRLPLL